MWYQLHMNDTNSNSMPSLPYCFHHPPGPLPPPILLQLISPIPPQSWPWPVGPMKSSFLVIFFIIFLFCLSPSNEPGDQIVASDECKWVTVMEDPFCKPVFHMPDPPNDLLGIEGNLLEVGLGESCVKLGLALPKFGVCPGGANWCAGSCLSAGSISLCALIMHW